MSFNKKTIKDVSLNNKTVLLRTDYNVPLDDNGNITDDYRIKKSLPTIDYLLERNCKVIICSHLGRPKTADDKKYSLRPVAKRLGELTKKDVLFADDCIGMDAVEAAKKLKPKQILVLENLRFYPEEEANDDGFAKKLASLAEVFVQDGFGVVHRAHASTSAITKHLPSVAGLLLENEVDTITKVMEQPERPLLAVLGGAKISDKIEILNRFIDIADVVAVGGAMANTFLMAEGIKIGKSLVDPSELPLAKDIISRAKNKSKRQKFVFYLPQDGVVATSLSSPRSTRIVDWDAHVIADIEAYPRRSPHQSGQVLLHEEILDIGPFSGAFISGAIQLSKTVVWNGVVGVTETVPLMGPVGPFAHGTELIIDAILGQYGNKPFSLIGGGDTAGYIEQRKLVDQFNHVSTGGGASLELMSGKKLPGVEALLNKDSKMLQ
jgi:phosphoglycerate kinase